MPLDLVHTKQELQVDQLNKAGVMPSSPRHVQYGERSDDHIKHMDGHYSGGTAHCLPIEGMAAGWVDNVPDIHGTV